MFQCKIDGCDSPHETEHGLAQHLRQTNAEAHPENMGDCWMLVREWYPAEDGPATGGGSSSESSSASSSSSETGGSGGADREGPAKQVPPADPVETDGSGSEVTEVDCWDCGRTNEVPEEYMEQGGFTCNYCSAPCEV